MESIGISKSSRGHAMQRMADWWLYDTQMRVSGTKSKSTSFPTFQIIHPIASASRSFTTFRTTSRVRPQSANKSNR